MTTTALAETSHRPGLIAQMAAKFKIEEGKLLPILKATAFRQQKANAEAITNEQMAALLVVADQYGLNPFTKELFAYPDKGAIVPVVSVDGWIRIINDHPALDGISFTYSEDMAESEDAKPCPVWCEVTITRKDRSQPIVVREYLDEVYRPPFAPANGGKIKGPWQSHTKRMLRHKTLIQGARIAFGFSGIYDDDEATRIIEAEHVPTAPAGSGKGGVKAMEQELARRKAEKDVTPEPDPQTISPATIESAMRMATTLEALDAAADLVNTIEVGEDVAKQLGDLYHGLRQEMEESIERQNGGAQ